MSNAELILSDNSTVSFPQSTAVSRSLTTLVIAVECNASACTANRVVVFHRTPPVATDLPDTGGTFSSVCDLIIATAYW